MAKIHEELRDRLIVRLEELANEFHWAERDPDDKNPDIVNKEQWKARVLDARAKLSTLKKETRDLIAEIGRLLV